MFTTSGAALAGVAVTGVRRASAGTSLSVVHSEAIALPLLPSQTSWRLAGVASHLRYVERAEKTRWPKCRPGSAAGGELAR